MASKPQSKNQPKAAPPQQRGNQPTSRPQQQPPRAPGRDVAVAGGGGGLSKAVADAAAQYAGAGVSHAQEDNIIPLVYLLQSNSPQVQRGHEKHIDGAQAGDVWLRNEPDGENIINGQEGLVVQPCFFSKCWIEWLPDRGGFAGRHQDRPEDAALRTVVTDNGTEVQRWVRPNGNIVVETREYAVIVHVGDKRLGYVIPFSGSGHTPARNWMTTIGKKKLPNGADAPAFAYLYRLVPKLRTKGPNSWYQYDISLEGPVETLEDFNAGAELYEAFESGAKQAAAVDDTGGEDIGGGTADDGDIDGE